MAISPATDYETIILSDGTFGVRITEPGALPRTIGGFATKEEAENWTYEQTEPGERNERLPPVVPDQ